LRIFGQRSSLSTELDPGKPEALNLANLLCKGLINDLIGAGHSSQQVKIKGRGDTPFWPKNKGPPFRLKAYYNLKKSPKIAQKLQKREKSLKSAQNRPKWIVFERFLDIQV
jgi:hypothetical protein